jgi:hypothetical protein
MPLDLYIFQMDFIMHNTKFFLPLILMMTAPMLAGCATAIEGATQQVSFETVGAADADCTIQTGTRDYRYNVRPPQSIWIQKSRKPLFVVCTAPGNRVKNLTVDSQVAGTTFLNGLNGGLGAGWDAESGAMYKYPAEVIIDFTGVAAEPRPLPAYENYDALPAKEQGIEYLGPDTAALNEDKVTAANTKAAYDEAARMEAEKAAFDAEKERRINGLEGGFYGDKGGKVAQPAPVVETPVVKPVAPVTSPSPLPAPTVLVPQTKDDTTVVPKAPTLGQPLFPSSTSF